ncbi:MAG: cytochrome c [Myxococcota bacterium]|nr:cytochrome c [Myxococcota bacterium]
MLFLLSLLACEGEDTGTDREADIAALQGDTANGETLYSTCQGCHGAAGEGTDSGPGIAGESKAEIIETVLYGEDTMPAYESWADQDIADVTAYVLTF